MTILGVIILMLGYISTGYAVWRADRFNKKYDLNLKFYYRGPSWRELKRIADKTNKLELRKEIALFFKFVFLGYALVLLGVILVTGMLARA